MSEKRQAWDVSVNICTYNRCGLLGEALEGILCQALTACAMRSSSSTTTRATPRERLSRAS
jgi:hypothetical protein